MKKVLVVIDMQNDFINGSLGSFEAQTIVPKVAEKIKNIDNKTLLFLTRDTHYSNYFDTFEGKNLPVAHCIKNTKGWELNEDIIKAADFWFYEIINKPTFGSEELADILKDLAGSFPQDMEIEICGLCTDICVVSNALMIRAYLPEATIIVDSNCCAGTTPENHTAALKVMSSCQIKVI